jgi:dGTP triphosphohydrolase
LTLQEPDAKGNALRHSDPTNELEIKLLQRLVRYYVITPPKLGTLQLGQREIIRTLFKFCLRDVVRDESPKLIPPRFLEDWTNLLVHSKSEDEPHQGEVRLVIDIVASLTVARATQIYRHLTGAESGSILETLHE